MYKITDMGRKKGTPLKIQDWNSTPYFSLTLATGEAGMNWHTVFMCEKCRCLFSRFDPARVLKAKPKTPGKRVVSPPPEIPLYCESCCAQVREGRVDK